MTHAQRAPGYRIRVDPIACQAHGLCAELLPEHVELDEWGYPIVVAEVSAAHRRQARRAVTACPTLAVRLEPTDPPGPA